MIINKEKNMLLIDEVEKYCKNDVYILTKSLVKFHDMVLNIPNIEILFDLKILTISSMALQIFMKL